MRRSDKAASTLVGRDEIVTKRVLGKRSGPEWSVWYVADDFLYIGLESVYRVSSVKIFILWSIAGEGGPSNLAFIP